MAEESRVKKTLLNMRINMIAYFIAIVVSFFTRKIFLDQLGAEFMGLSTTVNSLLGFLNLTELGVGTAIAYYLYKPIFQQDRESINEILSIMGYLYRIIGVIILIGGVILSFFIPLIFSKADLPWIIIYYCYYVQLFASLIGYFLNYKPTTLFSADQRMYLVNGYFQATQLIMIVVQAVLALYMRSFMLYITLTLLFSLINTFILNWKFRKVYPWVKTNLSKGREYLKKRPEILKYVSRVFIHDIGGFVNSSVTPLIMYGYASLTMVSLYGNYTLLNSKVSRFIEGALSGTSASVGNLIAEGNRMNTINCFKELFSIKFFLVLVPALCLYRFNSAFITLWLGEEYVLSDAIVFLIMADFCMNLVRNTTDQYLDGYGLKADVWVPVCRIISLAFVILGGYYWGIVGVLLVPVIVQLTLIHIWKPFYLYHSGFKEPFMSYVKLLVTNVLPFALAYLFSSFLSETMGYGEINPSTWIGFIKECLVFSIPFFIFAAVLSSLCCEGFRLFVHRVIHMIKH